VRFVGLAALAAVVAFGVVAPGSAVALGGAPPEWVLVVAKTPIGDNQYPFQGAGGPRMVGAAAPSDEAWLDLPAPLLIAAPFDPPESAWGAGHRGIDLWREAGEPVVSPGDGVVMFASDVAGRGIVVVLHASGLRSTLEPVTASVGVGDAVARGEHVGVVEACGSHCAPSSCLHWGVRRGDDYVDPLDVLAGYGPIRLLPLRE